VEIEEFIRAGLYDPTAPGAEERLALLRLNAEYGVSLEEMVEEREEGRLALLAGRRVNLGGDTRLSLSDVAAHTGEPADLLAQIWRASGFAEPDPDEAIFTESTLELLSLFKAASELYGEDVTLQLARVIGSSIARIADAEVTAFVQNIAAPLVEAKKELAIAQAHVQLASLNPLLARALDLAHRYHCEAALRRVALVPGSGQGRRLAVGFADLVGFTALSQALAAPELATAIGAFESRASETVTSAGGRVVKLIGDEVMFVADGAKAGCEIVLRLVERFQEDDLLPPIRGGLASGETITQEGDYYGPVVNLAARITKVARPGTVLVSEQLKYEVEDAAHYTFRRIGHRHLKGFNQPVTLYALRRASDA